MGKERSLLSYALCCYHVACSGLYEEENTLLVIQRHSKSPPLTVCSPGFQGSPESITPRSHLANGIIVSRREQAFQKGIGSSGAHKSIFESSKLFPPHQHDTTSATLHPPETP